ncbi:MAG: PmoA family protein [Planctomycetaceae bacterium]|nr:PmoA family protein [Planctomycetaceae bacterium]
MGNSFRAFVLCAACTLLQPFTVEAGKVTAEKAEHAVRIFVDGEHFTTFNYAPAQRKTYFHPVYAPGKTLVVREEVFGKEEQQGNDLKTNLGHFHHKGIWIAIDSINEEKLNFWHEGNQIRNESVAVAQQGDNVVLEVHNSWLDNENQPILKEETRYTITPDRLIACELKLTAVGKPVTFGDTKEGLFAVRLEKNLREVASGKISNAEGKQGESECWGLPSAWVDYSGEVEGKTVGITIFDDPRNFRPSRYHVRAYGLFSINPFGERNYSKGQAEAQERTIQPGEAVQLRYGLYVHAGNREAGGVPEQFQKFVALKK